MDLRLNGKRALVTGSSSGIGTAIARLFAAEGASVVVHGRDVARTRAVAEEIKRAGASAALVTGDVEKEAEKIAEAADRAFGGIDILVNNAGGPSDMAAGLGFFDVTPAHWLASYERNVLSAVKLSEYFIPQMKQRGWGRILQITSGLAYTPQGSIPDYAGSKAALNNFTLNLSKAVANTGITVNGVSPGMTITPTLTAWLESVAAANGLGQDAAKGEQFVLKNMVHQTVARLGRPEDVANVVVFLASPLADYVNGTTWRADGGGSPSVN